MNSATKQIADTAEKVCDPAAEIGTQAVALGWGDAPELYVALADLKQAQAALFACRDRLADIEHERQDAVDTCR
jgi:hypothetical protein